MWRHWIGYEAPDGTLWAPIEAGASDTWAEAFDKAFKGVKWFRRIRKRDYYNPIIATVRKDEPDVGSV